VRVVNIFPGRTIGVFFLLTLPGQSQVQESRRSATEIPFELVSGFLIEFRGDLGSLSGLKFILDTGATHSIVD
jgi:hypothetical protein